MRAQHFHAVQKLDSTPRPRRIFSGRNANLRNAISALYRKTQRRTHHAPWNTTEDGSLTEAVGRCGENWDAVSAYVATRDAQQCKERHIALSRQRERHSQVASLPALRQRRDLHCKFKPVRYPKRTQREQYNAVCDNLTSCTMSTFFIVELLVMQTILERYPKNKVAKKTPLILSLPKLQRKVDSHNSASTNMQSTAVYASANPLQPTRTNNHRVFRTDYEIDDTVMVQGFSISDRNHMLNGKRGKVLRVPGPGVVHVQVPGLHVFQQCAEIGPQHLLLINRASKDGSARSRARLQAINDAFDGYSRILRRALSCPDGPSVTAVVSSIEAQKKVLSNLQTLRERHAAL